MTLSVNYFGPIFEKATSIFDQINEALLDVAANTGLISRKDQRKWKSQGDYASFQRVFYDDFATSQANTGNLGQFMKRKGSAQATFMGSLEAMIFQIPNTMARAYNNMFWTKFSEFVAGYGQSIQIGRAHV